MQKPNLKSNLLFILFWGLSFVLAEGMFIFLKTLPNYYQTVLNFPFIPRNIILNIDIPILAGLQWMILRNRIRYSVLWGLVTLVGGLLGGFLSTAFAFAVSLNPPSYFPRGVIGNVLALAITWGILGFFMGLFQSGVLWFQVKRAGWWALATTAAYTIISPIHISINMLMNFFVPFLNKGIFKDLIGLIPIIFSALMMGAALLWLLEHPKEKVEESTERKNLEQIS